MTSEQETLAYGGCPQGFLADMMKFFTEHCVNVAVTVINHHEFVGSTRETVWEVLDQIEARCSQLSELFSKHELYDEAEMRKVPLQLLWQQEPIVMETIKRMIFLRDVPHTFMGFEIYSVDTWTYDRVLHFCESSICALQKLLQDFEGHEEYLVFIVHVFYLL
jgi:hypothetical protein